MPRKVIRIDETGYYVEDVILEDDELCGEDCVEVLPSQDVPLHRPRWNRETQSWGEGMPQAEIDDRLRRIARNREIMGEILTFLQSPTTDPRVDLDKIKRYLLIQLFPASIQGQEAARELGVEEDVWSS